MPRMRRDPSNPISHAFIYPLPTGAHECLRPDITGYYKKVKKLLTAKKWDLYDEVFMTARPEFGWGPCLWREIGKDGLPDDFAKCPYEKYHGSRGPFCRDHMRAKMIMNSIQRGVKGYEGTRLDFIDPPDPAVRIQRNPPAPIQIIQPGAISPVTPQDIGGTYGNQPPPEIMALADATKWESIMDVIKFTQKLARMVVLGRVSDKESRAALAVTRIAIKALDSQYLVYKLSLMMRAVQRGELDASQAVQGLISEIEGRNPEDAQSMANHGLDPRAAGLYDIARDAEEILKRDGKLPNLTRMASDVPR